jgi:citrate synthase
VAWFDRHRRGLPLVEPRSDLSFAANFLYMLNGKEPTPAMTRAFDICMILHADHGLNNSRLRPGSSPRPCPTCTRRSPAPSGPCVGRCTAVPTKKVMEMLNEIPSLEAVEPYIMDKLAHRHEGARIMGFGHRVYKTIDPRATFLKTFSKQIATDTGNLKLYEMSTKIEQIMAREVASKGIYPNVDFYSGDDVPLDRAQARPCSHRCSRCRASAAGRATASSSSWTTASSGPKPSTSARTP